MHRSSKPVDLFLMFYEIQGVKQESGAPFRRWFHADDMDLSIWLEGSDPVRFQLSYNRHLGEKSILWNRDSGFSHFSIDDGEQQPGHYKASPIVTGYLPMDFLQAITAFKQHAEPMSEDIFDFVLQKLKEGHRILE